MKKDIKKLINEVFNDEDFFKSLGFSIQESILLHLLIKGENLSTIANHLGLSYSVMQSMKSKSLYLLPIYIHRKLAVVNHSDFQNINSQLISLNTSIVNYLKELGHNNVFDIRELNLSKRTLNCLIASNIKNTNELINYDRTDLMQIKNLGGQGMVEIELELERLGLELKG